MRSFRPKKRFARSESGAVTVDWVVLAAAIVGVAIAVMSMIGGSVRGLSSKISAELSSQQAE